MSQPDSDKTKQQITNWTDKERCNELSKEDKYISKRTKSNPSTTKCESDWDVQVPTGHVGMLLVMWSSSSVVQGYDRNYPVCLCVQFGDATWQARYWLTSHTTVKSWLHCCRPTCLPPQPQHYTKIFCRKFSNCSTPTVFICNMPMIRSRLVLYGQLSE